jgi:2-keto-4-pentenoate hydratase/2-oxohepta-3-ene-1,7-dioic acid hydratase in catechol pathway
MTSRFASFVDPNDRPSFGLLTDAGIVDLLKRAIAPDLRTLIANEMLTEAGRLSGEPIDYPTGAVRLLPVIPSPSRILCVGLNYKTHLQETGRSDSEYPTIFLRFGSSQVGHASPLIRPRESVKFDYEGELAVIIGRSGRRIAREAALDHVAGYSCYNDGSVRDWQKHTSQWAPGKNFEGTGAFGPWMIPANSLPDRNRCALVTRLNGKEVQRAVLSQMIFSIEDIIAYVSAFTTLQPGDVIVSGTPGGVGDKRDPPLYMRHGDTVSVEIDGIGRLENTVVDEK